MISLINNKILYFSLIFLALFVFSKPLSGHLYTAEHNAEKAAMQKVIGNLLDWKSMPDEKARSSALGTTVKSSEMKFMRQLFDYSTNEKVLGNTVRSFRPIIASRPKCEGLYGLVFQLNSLRPREMLLSAEMHFKPQPKLDQDKSVISKTQHTRPYQLEVIKSCHQARVYQGEQTSHKQWTSFELKGSVEQMLQMNNTHLFIRVLQNGKALSRKQVVRFVRHHSPFLTVISKSMISSKVQEDQNTPLRSKREIHFSFSGPFEQHRRGHRSRKIARQVETPSYYSYDMRGNGISQDEKNKNYIEKTMMSGQQPRLKAQFQTFRTIGPKVLTPRKQKNKSRRPKPRYELSDSMMGFGRMDDDRVEGNKSTFLPFPTKLKTTELKKDNEREFNVSTDEKSQSNDITLVLLDQEKEKQSMAKKKCQKHSLKISFSDIGWDKWIIAPESFEAGYCDGSCSHQLETDNNPSNHAILQSILRSTNNQYSYLPQACCAPDGMDSLTLLYYDENENLVLKNYPKMLITSCTCL